MATLTIDHQKICFLIIKAREFDAKMEVETPEPGSSPADDDEREILFDYPDDPTAEEIRGLIANLNEDELAELLALTWVGGGDYDVDEWDDALAEARDNPDALRPDSFLGVPLLGDLLEEGLAELGLSCADVEFDRL